LSSSYLQMSLFVVYCRFTLIHYLSSFKVLVKRKNWQ
jgi:hypothetical protein